MMTDRQDSRLPSGSDVGVQCFSYQQVLCISACQRGVHGKSTRPPRITTSIGCWTMNTTRSCSLSSLANAIFARYRQTSQAEDLEEATAYNRQSLNLRPPGHPNRSDSLSNRADCILTRFGQTGQIEDLEDAIAHYHQSLHLRPLGHPNRPASLNNLANAVRLRFQQTGQKEDLEEAIECLRQSMDNRPHGHPNCYISLINLASAIRTRFWKTGKMDDLHHAAKYLSHAETILPTNHPAHASIWSELAAICLEQYGLDPSHDHLSMAFALYEHAANHHTASLKTRFAVALNWASEAGRRKHESTLRAYSISLTLLDRYLIVTPTVELQQKFLSSIPKSLALNAESGAIEVGQLDTAIEFLERRRTMILSKMQKYRHPLDELRTIDQGLAHEFEMLSSQLERLAITFESKQAIEGSQVSFEVQQRKQRILSGKWGEVVDKIRKVEGFTGFLQAVPFFTLRRAAAEGPVIVVNASQYRSDAIIIRDAELPLLVPLPKALPDDLARLSSKFSDPRASSKASFSNDLYPVLRELWDIIVGPITDQLAALGAVENTRIWWCPTSYLCALPLHAAGPYRSGQKCLPDLYISSYTSTLSALIASRSGMVSRTTAPNLLVIGDVGQPDSFIPNVEEELRGIKRLGKFVSVLVGQAANRNNILSGLQQHSWAHFSCHGNRDPEPFHSSFQIYAGEHLELLESMKRRLPNAEHAFLSACHAAAVDIQGTPDEVIHLASALQFCGFRSVVGTMWAMADIDGPDIAEDFYRYMFREPGYVAGFRDSARALDNATRAMRRREGMTLGRWVNFIHIGA